jgi:hypothetical protein
MPGRKSKKQKQYRNLSGLRNQPKASPAPTGSSYNPTPSPGGDGHDSDADDADLELIILFDSMKVSLQHEDEHSDPDDDDEEALEEWSGFHSPDLADAMGAMIYDDDPTDLDWVPSRMRKELVRREKMKKGMD